MDFSFKCASKSEIIQLIQMQLLRDLLTKKEYFVEYYSVSTNNSSLVTDFSQKNIFQFQIGNMPDRNSSPTELSCASTTNLETLIEPILSPLVSIISPNYQTTDLPISNFRVIKNKNIHKQNVAELMRAKEELKVPQGLTLIIRMIKKSKQGNQAKQDYKDKDQKWRDDTFNLSNVYVPVDKSQPQQCIQWCNLDQLIGRGLVKQPLCLINSPIKLTDIAQGSVVGDCYFLSAVAALTRFPERILRLFPCLTLDKNGIYMARLMFKGIIQEVVVDECFPVLLNENKLLGCQPTLSQNQIYVMILEKCWAKLWGSYESIDSGFPHEALHALTGALTKNYILSKYVSNSEKDEFFKRAAGFSKKGYVMCAGTQKVNSQKDQKVVQILYKNEKVNIKIKAAHIYCIQEIEERTKSVRLFNPWGFNTDEKNARLIQGEFTLSWDQFITSFHYLTVCKVHDNAHYLYTDLETCKKDHFTYVELNIHDAKTGYFAITVSETDKKENESKNNPYLTVTYVVFKCLGDPELNGQNYELMTVRTESKFSDHYLELHGMTAGRYMVAIYFSEVEVNEHLTFGIYSEDCFGFSEIKKQIQLNCEESLISRGLQTYNRKLGEKSARIYPIEGNENVWYYFNKANNSIFGYLILHVEEEQKMMCELTIKQKDFENCHLKAWIPHSKSPFNILNHFNPFYQPDHIDAPNTSHIVLKAQPGRDAVMVFTIENMNEFMERENKYEELHPGSCIFQNITIQRKLSPIQ